MIQSGYPLSTNFTCRHTWISILFHFLDIPGVPWDDFQQVTGNVPQQHSCRKIWR